MNLGEVHYLPLGVSRRETPLELSLVLLRKTPQISFTFRIAELH